MVKPSGELIFDRVLTGMANQFRIALMPAPIAEVQDLHRLMFANHLKPTIMCRQAGLAPSCWTRWSAGATPSETSLQAVREAVDLEIARRKEESHGRETVE